MKNLLKGALVGALALGGLAAASSESSAMPVNNVAPLATEAGVSGQVDQVYWRYGYGYGFRRPFFRPFGYGWGYRRPFYRPYGFYRPFRYRYYRW